MFIEISTLKKAARNFYISVTTIVVYSRDFTGVGMAHNIENQP